MEEPCEVCLVNMPFVDANMPSMALSLLKACLSRSGIRSMVQYEHLYYAKKCGLGEYQQTMYSPIHSLEGEIVFARAAHQQTLRSLAEYMDYVHHEILVAGSLSEPFRVWLDRWVRDFPRRQREAEAFIAEAAGRILRHRPKIVAMASMFRQINANIALARKLKELRPELVIMVGGANCTGEAGLALLDQIEAVDCVFLGEADEIFAEVCKGVLRRGSLLPEELPHGVLSRGSRCPEQLVHRITQDLNVLPLPDFSDFFAACEELGIPPENLYLMAEGSRGCWWGQRKPCSFCGLVGHARAYREKDTGRLADELQLLAQTWPQVKKCFLTDAILSMNQVRELPAAMRQRGIRLELFDEVKSNLTPEDVLGLSQAGFTRLQPGIESLQDDLLRLMNKGCRAIRQIEMLKSCRTYHVKALWNLLCGFPGEKESYLEETAALLPKLSHFDPPNLLMHIVYHRYSEYTEHPERYGLALQPSRVYEFAFADRDFIRRTAYLFEPAGAQERPVYRNCAVKGGAYAKTASLVAEWNRKKRNPDRLDMEVTPEGAEIYDMRAIARQPVYHLRGLAAKLYLACRRARTEASLLREFRGECEEEKIREMLDWLAGENLTVCIGGEHLALAIDRAEVGRVPVSRWRR